MIRLGELMMILELHRQGVSISAIARRTGRDPKTIRKYIERGVEGPVYGPRALGRSNKLAPYLEFLRERVTAFPDLTAARLTREIRELGYMGAYTAVKRFLAAIRPENGPKPFEVRFETPPGIQAQVDFARFVVDFADEPGISRIVWLFSLVLGHSRFLFARYVMHQDLQTLLRCHMQAFETIGGVPIEMGDLDGFAFADRIRSLDPTTAIIFMTAWPTTANAVDSVRRYGGLDYLEKPLDEERLLAAVAEGVDWSRQRRRQMSRTAALSPRERQVFELLIQGHSNKVIAGMLGFSPKTVEDHRASVMAKTGVNGLAQLIALGG
ncbi:hypothetical protein AX777_22345 [Sphingobium yanoikuyae]|uniref:Uncharacterized protein n=1 Tax=Sphingobium yanoikuyae TaxID=13690 RepID=A0A177JLU6_SPHYA|nr:hypothetical protein AX777_22345 [Sphingobium yanoikuyae]